jgi:CheY-like chemotaxis protein
MNTRLLVIEDDLFVSHIYRRHLTKAGFDVTLAHDGQTALDILSKTQPDLIILDLILPKIDGFAILQAIRSQPQTTSLPVIVVSNLCQEEDIQKCLRLGASCFAAKSNLTLVNLVNLIQHHLGSPTTTIVSSPLSDTSSLLPA